jgi:ketosteroid isomerase-like protein
MKKYICLFILLITVLVHVNGQSKQEQKLTAAVENFRKGIVDADQALLASITADSLVYGHSSGKVQNKAQFLEEISTAKPIDYLTVELTQQTITVSGNTAVVRHIFSSQINNNGTPGNLKIGNMLIWQKQHGKWKLLARQAYKI